MSTAKTFVVTGAAGFIGARVVEAIRHAGGALVSADYHREGRDNFARPEHRGIDFGTVVDFEELLDGNVPEGVHAIVHLGACSDTMELDASFLERVNVEYSKALWNYCAQKGITFVYASSAATYGAGELGYSDDESRLGQLAPLNPYGCSKAKFDVWALEQERAGNHPPAWSGFKFFNVYGFGERHKGRMASVVLHGYKQIRERGSIRLFRSHREGIADGEQKRDFVYVRDVVDVLRFAAEGGLRRGIFNLGTGGARTFYDLAVATFRALGLEPNVEFIDMPVELRERYQYFTEAEMARLRAAGYDKPFTSLEDGVKDYVARLLAYEESSA